MAVAVSARPDTVRRPWRLWLRQGLWAGIDLLFPPRCAGCHRPGARLCAACLSAFNLAPAPWCDHCGLPVALPGPCALCQAAPDRLAPLTGLRSLAWFDGPLQSALHRLKYQRDIILADNLGAILAQSALWSDLPAAALVPVPLSAVRQRERGYNRAALLARAVADWRGLPLARGAVRRTRHTPSQVGLSAAERRVNVHGAFAAHDSAAGRTFVLIDDVGTTGATLAACAAALVEAGAASVWGVTVARARFSPADVRPRAGRATAK